jgi:hypothetical protein
MRQRAPQVSGSPEAMRFGRRPRKPRRAAHTGASCQSPHPGSCTAAAGRWRPRVRRAGGACIRRTAVAPFQPTSCRHKVNGDEHQ